MNRIYDDAKDKNVAKTIVYFKAADSKYYYESTFKTEVTATEMLDLFFKGVVLLSEGVYYNPISCSTEGEIVFIAEEGDDDPSLGA